MKHYKQITDEIYETLLKISEKSKHQKLRELNHGHQKYIDDNCSDLNSSSEGQPFVIEQELGKGAFGVVYKIHFNSNPK